MAHWSNDHIERLMAERRYEEVYQGLQPRRDDPVLSLVLAIAATGAGYYADGLVLFARANQVLPTLEEAAVRYAQALLVHARPGEARRQLEDALRRFPNSPRLRYLKIRLDIDDHGVAASRREIESLLALAPKSAETRQLADAVAVIDGASPMVRDYGSRQASTQWDDFLLEQRHKDARFFGTARGLLNFAIGRAPAEGLTLEFGVYYGASINAIAAHTSGTVDGFDSFQGLPEPWVAGEPAGHYTTHGKLPIVPPNVRLHTGWFADTVPPFMSRASGPVRFAHIDCDLYSSTVTVLAALRPHLQPGAILLFDDFLGFGGAREHEYRAWTEFVAAHAIAFDYIGFVLLGRAAALQIKSS